MKKIIVALTLLIFSVTQAHAQTPSNPVYSNGVITKIISQTEITRDHETLYTQQLDVMQDQTKNAVQVEVGSETIPLTRDQIYHVGQRVILVAQIAQDGSTEYNIADQYRIPPMIWLAIAFFVIVILVSRLKGLLSLIAMALTIVVLFVYMVPQILAGSNPVLVSIIASGIISSIIVYLGHGFHYRSHIALFCMLVTLAFVAGLSFFVVRLAYLTGLGDENALYLQFPGVESLNLQGLFLGGIILAALSVLDDSVISQVSIIYQLKDAKKDISFQELFIRGMEVGKDHISTLVNTLILAYAGASLPLFILLSANNTSQPLWVALNSQTIAEEIVRTLTGSIGLILSIPLTTFIAAYVVHQKFVIDKHGHSHSH